jgi:AcrR family transcriptional regulator
MRQAARAAATRTALLTGAREVFTSAGFTDANITDVVSRAGASVGSLYHHFGGKADLYLALWEGFQQQMEQRAATAVAKLRADGETDPIAMFIAGTRAFLQGAWEERDLARLFLAGGGPPGFELVQRRRYREWTRLNAALLGSLGHGEADLQRDVLVMVLTAAVSEAGVEVAICDTEAHARALVDEVLALVARVAQPLGA